MDAPLCACGCGAPVKRRNGRWQTFARRGVCPGNFARGVSKPMGPTQQRGIAIWRRAQAMLRRDRLVALLQDVAAHRVTPASALNAVALYETRAYQRGYMKAKWERQQRLKAAS